MSIKTPFIILILANVFFIGCDKNGVASKGEAEIVTRTLDSFSGIDVGQKFKVFLTSDATKPMQISIDYYHKLNPQISTTVEHGVLYIKDNNRFDWLRPLDIQPVLTINTHFIDNLNIHGSCELSCLDSIVGNQINVHIHSVKPVHLKTDCGNLYGNSDDYGMVRFEGRGTIFSWSCEMGSWFDAWNLNCDDAYIRHYTQHDCKVNASKKLEINLFNSGNLYYKDTPTLNSLIINASGTGKAIKSK